MYERDEQLTTNGYIWLGHVREEDKWCYMKDAKPFGEIIMVPDVDKPLIELGIVGGAIIRSKKVKRTLLLQVVPTSKKLPEYVITNTLDSECSNNIINVKNLNK